MILVLAMEEDLHADAVLWYLQKHGAKVLRINPENFSPENDRLVCRPDLGKASLIWHGRKYDSSEIRAVYCRHYHFFSCADNAPLSEQLATSETSSALGGFFRNLDAFWINNPFREDMADNKLYQYRQAALQGFRVPKTLVCNDPESFMQFYEQCNGQVIIKQLGEICLLEQEKFVNPQGLTDMRAWGFFTQRVQAEHLRHLEELTAAPCLFQEEIKKKAELRINIVGKECFAWRIFSQTHPDSLIDFRKVDTLPFEKIVLALDIGQMLVELVQSWGLVFAAVDMVETPENELVFLEANVCGNWLWLEPGGESQVAESIAEKLLKA